MLQVNFFCPKMPNITEDCYEDLLNWANMELSLPEQENIHTHENYEKICSDLKETLEADIEWIQKEENESLNMLDVIYDDYLKMVFEKGRQLEAMENTLQQNKDYANLVHIHKTKVEEVKTLQEDFGDKSTIDMILQSYKDTYQFKIMYCELINENRNDINRVVLQFIINDRLDLLFPVKLDIDVVSQKVIDIETEIYPREKLLIWLNEHNKSILELILTLRKILIKNQAMLSSK